MRREFNRALITSVLLTFSFLLLIGYYSIKQENAALTFAVDTLERTTWAQRELRLETEKN